MTLTTEAPLQVTVSRRGREDRERLVLDTAARLFYARGVHAVGMDELVRDTGLGKASVYRLFPSKDDLVAAYLRRHSAAVLDRFDADVSAHPGQPRAALAAVLATLEAELRAPGFRGCAFNNASMEFDDPAHPARVVARFHRRALRRRLAGLAERIAPGRGEELGDCLALIVDGTYTSAAHLGAEGPAGRARAVVETLLGPASRA
jgi:AcrR family transcriptional regulator